MQKVVTLDDSLRGMLNGCQEEVEFIDESGRPVGHFLPQDVYQKMLYAWVESQCPFSKEELERRRRETGGRSLKEIWKDLGVQ